MKTKQTFPLSLLVLMASVTFLAILSELIPSGILPQLSNDLHISEAQAGNLIGWYAIASAVFSIPIVTKTMHVNRKKLLIILMAGFSLSNLMVALSTNYGVAITGRVIGGICAGVLWPMISAYGMRMVSDEHKGKAVAVIMSGTTFGMSLGLPLMTWIGNTYGWKVEFITLAVIIAIIGILCFFFLPSISGEQPTAGNSLTTVIRNKGVLMIVLFTLLAVASNYGVYTYITNLVDYLNYSGGIELAQIIFGIGSILSVVIAGRFIDQHIRQLTVFMLGISAIAFLVFYGLDDVMILNHIAFFAWGLGFGALVTLFQSAVARQVSIEASDIATSLQSATFNFSIMLASSLGGMILTSGGMNPLLIFAIVLLVIGAVIAAMSKKTLQ